MLLLIFPKYFEFFQFYKAFVSTHNVIFHYQFPNMDNHICCIIVEINSIKYQFLYTIIDDSDVSFSAQFVKLICEIKNNIDDLDYRSIVFTIIGTAATNIIEIELGKCIPIESSYRIDRGFIDKITKMKNKEMSYQFREDVRKTKNPKTRRTHNNYHFNESYQNMIAYTSNHIIECSHKKLRGIFDMETYDFFAISEKMNLRCYYCFRIISDYNDKKLYKTEITPPEIKKKRKEISFDNCFYYIFELIFALKFTRDQNIDVDLLNNLPFKYTFFIKDNLDKINQNNILKYKREINNIYFNKTNLNKYQMFNNLFQDVI